MEALGYTVNDAGASPDTITIIAPWTFDTKIGAAANVAATAVSVGILNIESTATTLTAKLFGNALPANTVSRPAAGIAVSTGAVYFITANSRQVIVVGAGTSQLEVISPTNAFVTAIPAL